MDDDKRPIKALAEIALRVNDHDMMHGLEKARLESLNLTVSTAEHAWVHWRSLYVTDPEGNDVEWVCYDPSVK